MFCDNCGNQLDPSFRYCSQCGKDSQPQPDVSICMTCGAPLIPGAKFCNNCGSVTAPASGTANKPSVSFCKYCSLEYHPQDKFCKQCGQPKDNGRSSGGSFIKAVSGNGLLYSPTDLHQMILGALFAILFLLWFIPSIAMSAEIPFTSSSISITTCFGLPFTNDILAVAADSTPTTVLLTIGIFIIDVIPLLGCVGLSVLAILKGQLNPKFLLIQMIVAAKTVIAPFFYWIVYAIALGESEGASVFLTFGGWVIFLLASLTALAAFWLFMQIKRLQNQH